MIVRPVPKRLRLVSEASEDPVQRKRRPKREAPHPFAVSEMRVFVTRTGETIKRLVNAPGGFKEIPLGEENRK